LLPISFHTESQVEEPAKCKVSFSHSFIESRKWWDVWKLCKEKASLKSFNYQNLDMPKLGIKGVFLLKIKIKIILSFYFYFYIMEGLSPKGNYNTITLGTDLSFIIKKNMHNLSRT
jgi:hypothetical protein